MTRQISLRLKPLIPTLFSLSLIGIAESADYKHAFSNEEKAWWAIQPVGNQAVPENGETWARNEIDFFVVRKLDENNLSPAPAASPRELVRRLYFDLHGLPPTPSQVEVFVTSFGKNSEIAYQNLVDELLASPRYGERWATHWLDVVRYAESDGYRADDFRPTVYLYRDYVIKSLNDDKPYDQFVREQLAGDELAPDDPEVLIATAFLRLGIYEHNQRNARMQWELIMNEMTNVTAEAFLGLGIGCAQCHDHKFDPLLQKDYYSLQSFLSSVWWPENRKLGTSEQIAALQAWKKETLELRQQIAAIENEAHKSKIQFAVNQFPKDVQEIYRKPATERSTYEEQLVQLVERQVQAQRRKQKVEDRLKGKAEEMSTYKNLKAKLTESEKKKPKLIDAFITFDISEKPARTFIPASKDKTEVEPAFLTLLGLPPPKISPNKFSTGRRTALAEWITNEKNPLSTRVIVNRVWQQHFGQGIVPTPNDFGTLGEPPSHPKLLDWLTRRFIKNGWRLKPLHKLILTSSTYRQTARNEPSTQAKLTDPGNRLLWRFPPSRLSAEQVRDAMLALSGELRERKDGPSDSDGSNVRSIYLKKMRNNPNAVLTAFDAPTGFESSPTRQKTTTPKQALLMSNSEWPRIRARAFAKRLLKKRKSIDPSLVEDAYVYAYARPPDNDERDDALAYLLELAHISAPKSNVAQRSDKFPHENGLRPIEQAFEKVDADFFGLGSRSLWLQPGSRFEQLQWAEPSNLGDSFTIEVVVTLDAIHADASVNTLASRWNGNHRSPGWTFGVTSAKSRYDPRNFILQVIGENIGGDLIYEVVPSNLRIPLGKPVNLATSISTSSDGKSNATFHFLDLSIADAILQSSQVDFNVANRLQKAATKFLIGGRDQIGHLWDGQLARLVLTPATLSKKDLLVSTGTSTVLKEKPQHRPPLGCVALFQNQTRTPPLPLLRSATFVRLCLTQTSFSISTSICIHVL